MPDEWQGGLTIMELHPGPPLIHIARGAVVGLERDSKNQNHMFMFVPEMSAGSDNGKRETLTNGQITRVLVHSGRRLTYP